MHLPCRSRRRPILALVLALASSHAAQAADPAQSAKPLQRAASLAVIKGWIEAHKVLGIPGYLESKQEGSEVFAAWNIPTSGFNGTDFWIYCRHDQTSDWHLIASAWFVPGADQVHSAVVDPALREVHFLGAGGQVYHRVSLASCLVTRDP